MSEFNKSTIDHLKKLCKLDCTPEEEVAILNSIDKILDYMQSLNEVDTSHVSPCTYVLSSMLKNQMRDDEVKDLLSRERFLANAPDQIGGMVKVPPVLK